MFYGGKKLNPIILFAPWTAPGMQGFAQKPEFIYAAVTSFHIWSVDITARAPLNTGV